MFECVQVPRRNCLGKTLIRKKVAEVLKLSTILLINHEEAEQFTGQSEIANAASELLSYGPEIVVIKRGADGAYLAHGDVRHSVPVFPINMLNDPTGAGDTFAGGFMGYLSQSSRPDFLEAVIMGSAMASFCVEGFGVESLLSATPELLEHSQAVGYFRCSQPKLTAPLCLTSTLLESTQDAVARQGCPWSCHL